MDESPYAVHSNVTLPPVATYCFDGVGPVIAGERDDISKGFVFMITHDYCTCLCMIREIRS